jgi:hypothetical protein
MEATFIVHCRAALRVAVERLARRADNRAMTDASATSLEVRYASRRALFVAAALYSAPWGF